MRNNLTIHLLLLITLASELTIAQPSTGSKDISAENMLLWQRSNGGWPKDTYTIFFDDTKTKTDTARGSLIKVLIDYKKEQTPQQRKLALDTKEFKDATIDNGHTVKEIRYLLQAHTDNGNLEYLRAAEKGIRYLLEAQYENGGWPQFYPDKRSYKHDITFNDDAMTNVMNLMLDVVLEINNTLPVDLQYAKLARQAFDKGIDILLKTQLEVNGKKTAWCAQYDETTLQPAKARNYELPSLSGHESVGIVKVLMRMERPSDEVKKAITGAINWFQEVKITGYKAERVVDNFQPKKEDVVVVPDASSVIWARFYDLETNKPFFCDRDGIKKTTLAEIGIERRMGYAWYGTWPLKLITEDFPKWQKKNQLK